MFLPKPGLVVGNRYELTKAIGRGGMGEVWKAHDRELDTACAVKFILQHLATDRGIRERFSREARAVARLRSPHVVQILGVGEVEDTPYLAMELLSGETLLARLDRLGKLDPLATMKVIEQVGDALESAHQAGIVHRDLKPENIWFWSGNKVFVKVLDFGVAKTGLKTGSLQTATGALVGTPQYMSPEQALGNRDVDHRSDLWSLAVITIECLCGKRPFESEGLGDLLLKIVSDKPPSLHELAPELPSSLHDWWVQALARDPQQRFQSASELVEALRPHLVGNAPYSQLAHSGFPNSGFPNSGFPNSGFPNSGFPSSGFPNSGPAHSGFPNSAPAHSGNAHSGHTGRAQEEDSYARGPVVTDAGGVVGAPSDPVSRPMFPTELQPRSADRHDAGSPSVQHNSVQHNSAQHNSVHNSAQPHSGLPKSGFQPFSSQPRSGHPEAPQPSTGSGVVSERAQRPVGGSVGPISSSRRSPARDSRQRTVVIAAALVTVGVVGTAWRMLGSDVPRAMSSLPPPASPESTAQPASDDNAVPPAELPPAVIPSPLAAKPVAAADLPGSNPWESALGNPRPGETRTAVEALQPRPPQPAPAPAAEETPAVASRATASPATASPADAPPRATPPRAAPAAPALARPAVPPRKAPPISAADVGLSAPPPSKVNPAQSAAKPGAASSPSAPSQGAGQVESEEERRAKLKRKIGLGSK